MVAGMASGFIPKFGEGVFAGSAVFLGMASVASAGDDVFRVKPNIVFILADDMGVGDVSGLYPAGKISTPHIDALVKDGMVFTDAHSSSSVCTPSRYGIVTGRYCWRTTLKGRVLNGYSPCLIPPTRSTVASMLGKHGYDTAIIGKWHLGITWTKKDGSVYTQLRVDSSDAEKEVDFSKPIKVGPPQLGFDYFFGVAASWDMPPYAFIENDRLRYTKLVEFKSDSRDEPKEVRDAIAKGVKGDDLKKIKRSCPGVFQRAGLKDSAVDPVNAMSVFAGKAKEYVASRNPEKPFFLYLPVTAPHTPVIPSDEFRGTSGAGVYGDYVREVDWFVGQVVGALKAKGLYKNTLLIFSADNGYSIRAFPDAMRKKYGHSSAGKYAGCKARLTEGGHRVPFIVTWPGVVKPGRESGDLVSLMDFYATCADIVGAKIASSGEAEDSFSFLPELQGAGRGGRRSIVHQDFSGYLGVREGDWKLVFPRMGKGSLRNLKDDLSERHSFSRNNPERVEALKKLLTLIVTEGASVPGRSGKNDGPGWWEQLRWMKKP